jgi:uncharacterized damage-inducible protein DinB
MPVNTLEQLLNYNRWANETILRRLEELGQSLPHSSLRLMSHIVNAQSVWSQRIKSEPLIVGVWDEHDLERCKQLNEETLRVFKAALDRLGDSPGDSLDRVMAYKTTSGAAFESTLHEIFLQVFTHGSYHRGQIAMDLRQNGLEPVNTDYIIFIRTMR